MPPYSRFIAAPGLLAVLGLSSSALAAQRNESTQWLERCHELGLTFSDTRYCEVRELGFRPQGTIRVEVTQMGGIEVRAWDHDSVHVQARLQAAHPTLDSAARDLVREVRVEASARGVRALQPAGRSDGRWLVMFVLSVPRHSDLALTASHGPLTVEGVSGRMELEVDTGPLSLRSVAGDVRGRARNGPVAVTLSGARWEGRGLDVETLNGPVVLKVPRQYSAHLEAGTLSGPTSVEFPVRGTQRRTTNLVETDLGNGGATVRVVTRLGPAILQRS